MAEPRIGAKMTLDATRFQSGLRVAEGAANRAALGMKTAFSGVAGMFGVSVAGAFTGGGLVAGITKSVAAMSSLYDISRKSGANFEAFQRVSQAFRESGVSTEKFAATLPKIIKSVGEAMDGTKTYADAFAQLNINLEEFSQQEPTEMLLRMADAWNASSKSAQDFNAMTIIMGKSAADMRQALDAGREGIESIGRTIEVTSTQSIERLKAVEDRITKVKQSMLAVGAEIANDILDVGEGVTFPNTRALFEQQGLKGLVTGRYLPFGDLASALFGDVEASQTGIRQGQQRQTDRATLERLRQTLGGAVTQYNALSDTQDKIRMSAAIERLQSTIAQLAYNISSMTGESVQTDPIGEGF